MIWVALVAAAFLFPAALIGALQFAFYATLILIGIAVALFIIGSLANGK